MYRDVLGLYGFVSPRRVRGCQFFQIERFLINILINILFGGLQSRAAILDEETLTAARTQTSWGINSRFEYVIDELKIYCIFKS